MLEGDQTAPVALGRYQQRAEEGRRDEETIFLQYKPREWQGLDNQSLAYRHRGNLEGEMVPSERTNVMRSRFSECGGEISVF